jgi:Protein of unknown function (DUF3140)
VVNRNDSVFVETWETFHDLVNMTSPELRDWLMNTPDGADTYAPEPDIDIHALGMQVLQIKQKRRVDITESDMGTMQEVIDLIEGRLRNAPESDIQDDPWRDTLMTLGHDPTRPDSPRGEDAEV